MSKLQYLDAEFQAYPVTPRCQKFLTRLFFFQSFFYRYQRQQQFPIRIFEILYAKELPFLNFQLPIKMQT